MSSCRSDMCSHLFCHEMVNSMQMKEPLIVTYNQDDVCITRLHFCRRRGILVTGEILRIYDSYNGIEFEVIICLSFEFAYLECQRRREG